MNKIKVICLYFLLVVALSACANSNTSLHNSASVEENAPELVEQQGGDVIESEPFKSTLPHFEMATVPASNYYNDLQEDEPELGFINPIENLTADQFEIGETEVTYELWYAVRIWAEEQGYQFENKGCEGSQGREGNKPTEAKHEPVTCVCWKDCIVWLNALSEMDGKEPVYLDKEGNVHRNATGSSQDVFSEENIIVANKDGYRLPTATEWEVAARYIDGTNWTYYNNASGSPVNTENRKVTQEFVVYNQDKTADVATRKPNALGVYDMSGNVNEWCFDAYNYPYDETIYRVFCGGSWRAHEPHGQSVRVRRDAPATRAQEYNDNSVGFRIARSFE